MTGSGQTCKHMHFEAKYRSNIRVKKPIRNKTTCICRQRQNKKKLEIKNKIKIRKSRDLYSS